MLKDQIFIEKAPKAWPARLVLTKTIKSFRRQKLLPSNRPIFLSVGFVGTAEMKRLNKKFRGKNQPTDILSFEQSSKAKNKGPLFLGDMLLCVPVVRKQAKEHGHSARNELAVLFVHGILHLLGYDHERSVRAAKKMAAEEAKLLKGISGLIFRSAL